MGHGSRALVCGYHIPGLLERCAAVYDGSTHSRATAKT
jgi:hypothetical protein